MSSEAKFERSVEEYRIATCEYSGLSVYSKIYKIEKKKVSKLWSNWIVSDQLTFIDNRMRDCSLDIVSDRKNPTSVAKSYQSLSNDIWLVS